MSLLLVKIVRNYDSNCCDKFLYTSRTLYRLYNQVKYDYTRVSSCAFESTDFLGGDTVNCEIHVHLHGR